MSEFAMPSMFFPRSGRALRQACMTGAMLLFCSLAHAQVPVPNHFEQDFDEEDKPWQEIAVQLPPAPSAENLVIFPTTATATHTFAVDTKSVSVGADDVVRYTLVATSAAGAKTISYEGIRCASFERKLYAFGQPNGSWSRARRDKWEPIPRTTGSLHHVALAREYFCVDKGVAGDAKDIVQRMRSARPMNLQNN